MIVLVCLAGGLAGCGLMLLVAELAGAVQVPGTPPGVRGYGGMVAAGGRRALPGLAAGLAMLAVTRWPVAAIAAALAVVFLPKLMSGRAARQRTAVLEGLEQWSRRLAAMLSASRGLEDALEASARTAPAAIASQVTALARRLSARTGTQQALRAFASEIDDPAGDRIVAALLIATGQRGGGVQGVLTALAELLARDVAARREIEASRAEHRTTIRWIIAFVAGFTAFAIFNRSYSAPYGTLAGEVMLGLVASLYAAALWWLHRLGQIPVPGRFLDQAPASPKDPRAYPVPSGGAR